MLSNDPPEAAGGDAMQVVKVEESVGTVLCHDITRIVIGEGKGPAFRKGHMITAEDIPELQKLGKRHVYVWKLDEGMVHENDAAIQIATGHHRQWTHSERAKGRQSQSACQSCRHVLHQ
jgi:hypothetical protein